MTTVNEAQAKVAQFHKHVRVLERAELREMIIHADFLRECVDDLHRLAAALEQVIEDPIGLRMHLEVEELAEKFEAMVEGDEVKALDGAADQLYVLLGTAAIYDWPLETAFNVVHASNMTKEKQPDDPSAARVRQKGPNYQPPDIRSVLADHRSAPLFTNARGST